MSYRTPTNQQNLREVWEAIEEAVSPNEASLMRSALLRFTIPGLGGPKAIGDRLKNKEMINALNFLSTILIDENTPETLCVAQIKTFEILKTPKERQRQLRSYLNKFIALSTEKGFFLSAIEKGQPNEYRFYPEGYKFQNVKTTNRKGNVKFTLSLDPKDYEGSNLELEAVSKELTRIQESLKGFENYCLKVDEKRKPTSANHQYFILLIWGWLYTEKKISLNEIGFSSLVPFIDLKPEIGDFLDKKDPWMAHMLAKAIANEAIKKEANKLVALLNDFFTWLRNTPSTNTKKIYVQSVIALAKYVYRDQTDKTMTLSFEDIPIITRLRVFHAELDKKNNNRNSSKTINKYIPWDEVLQAFEKLRFEAGLTKIQCRKEKYTFTKNRRMSAIAKSLQDCVLLGMYILVPPPRQRVIRELELGRTLKYGLFINENFTPAEKLPNPDEAKYYIHLQPQDYKTGDTYGEWLGEFPNTQFSDGTCFYDYLGRWLFKGYQDDNGNWHGMRSILAREDTKTVFVAERTGESYPQQRMTVKIKNLFYRWTGVPLSPHDLRHIYRSYIENPDTGATHGEKESAAFWMRHSDKMAKKVYAHLDCKDKLVLGANLSQRINEQFFNQ
jgi:hypothetical protein